MMRDDPDRLQEISPDLFCYWRDLSVKHGCVCLDERIAMPKSINDAVLEDIHSTHPGSFACSHSLQISGGLTSIETYWQKPVSAKPARKLVRTLNQ